MEKHENESMANYTTFRMGGLAKKIYFPETVEDLKELENLDNASFHYILGGGSNLLINDEKKFEGVICTKKLNNIIEQKSEGKFYIGASMTLQKAIRTINEKGYGGIEYLYSVPGLIGGSIYMNAGRGKDFKKCISDYIISVDYYRDGEVYTIPVEDCMFNHRTSIFQQMKDTVIIGALFEFPCIEREEARQSIMERLELCRKVQDMSMPNMGSVFSECDIDIMNIVKQSQVGGRVMYSNKTINWLLNKGGTFREAISAINRVERMHQLNGKRCSVEVKIWD